MIGVGLVVFITIFASSTRASVTAAVDRAFTGDFVIDSGAGFAGGVDPGLADRLNNLPEVQAAVGVRVGMAELDGTVDDLAAADPRTAFDLIDLQPIAGSTNALGADAIAIHKDVAKEKRLKIGDTVPVVFKDSGERQMRVAVIYAEDQPAGNRYHYFLGIDAYEANFANRYDTQVFVKQAPGVRAGAALAAIERVTDNYPGVKVLDQADYKREQVQPVNQLLSLVYAMLALAIVIALLGIGNTLALSILERTRELGLLRAVGMTRSQLRTTIRWESVIIALQGTTLGLVIGLFFGWALVTALGDEGIDQFSVPMASLIVVVVLAAVAGVVAAVLPGRRASKLDVLRAVVTE
jgi:putative ABC transport system permease protein